MTFDMIQDLVSSNYLYDIECFLYNKRRFDESELNIGRSLVLTKT